MKHNHNHNINISELEFCSGDSEFESLTRRKLVSNLARAVSRRFTSDDQLFVGDAAYLWDISIQFLQIALYMEIDLR